jgi:outer membrane protein
MFYYEMRKTVKTIVFAILAFTAVAQAQPQKIGYLNAQAILADMQEVKAADSQLEAFAKQLANKDSVMVVTFQAKAADLQKKADEGTIAPVQLEQEKKKLEDERNKIAQYEQDMQQQMAKKRQELYQPLLDKVNKAIQEVAKENGFIYVIDAAAGTLLYADEKNDLQNLVRAKLGLPALAAETPKAATPVNKN